MAINDVYQVVIQSNFKNKAKGQNVFFYQQVTGTALGADAIARGAAATLALPLRNLQTGDISYEFVSTVNLFNRADIGSFNFPVGSVGLRIGSSEPSFVSVVYRIARTIATMKSGSKYFWGISENDVEDGEMQSGSFALLDALLSAIRAIPSVSGVQNGEFKPIVVKRIKYVEGGKTKYRLPESLSELVSYPVAGNASYLLPVSTRNSRKIGRGI